MHALWAPWGSREALNLYVYPPPPLVKRKIFVAVNCKQSKEIWGITKWEARVILLVQPQFSRADQSRSLPEK